VRASDFVTDHAFYERIGDTGRLLVVFNYFEQPLSIRTHSSVLLGQDCSRLYLHSGANDWFQNGVPGVADSFAGLIAFAKQTLRQVFEAEKVFFLGTSMAGFAALGCGLASQADGVLAAGPEIDLCLPGSRSRGILAETRLTFPSLRPLLENARRAPVYCLSGGRDPLDAEVALQLAAFPEIKTKTLDCDHQVLPYLREQGVLDALLRALLDQRDLLPLLEGL